MVAPLSWWTFVMLGWMVEILSRSAAIGVEANESPVRRVVVVYGLYLLVLLVCF